MSDIVKGGLVDTDGQLMQGDQILSVNGEDVRTATQEAMAALLKVRKRGVSVNERNICFKLCWTLKTTCASCFSAAWGP